MIDAAAGFACQAHAGQLIGATMPRCRLLLGDQEIWSNPADIGFFGIKLRKQLHEEKIMRRLDRRYLRWLIAITGGTMDADVL